MKVRVTPAAAIVSLLCAMSGATVSAETVEFLAGGSDLAPGLPFSPLVRAGDTYYLSGQVGTRPGMDELVAGGIEAEARQTLSNIRNVLVANGLGMRDVVKCTVMLADISEWARFNKVYVSFFDSPYPARSALGANGLALGARVEVECIAVRSDS